MGSGQRRRRSLFAVVITAAVLAALVPGRSVVRAYSAPIDAKLQKQLTAKPTSLAAAFVHFSKTTPFLDGIERVTSNGLKVGARFRSANTVYAFGLPTALQRLRADPRIARLEYPGTLATHLETATLATRARSLNQHTGGLDVRVPAPGGGFVDGTGSGVAIIDSGIDASNPDLDWCGNGPADTCKTVRNFKIACSTPLLANTTTGLCFGPTVMQEMENSDTTSGHGTHVSGIAAGTGSVSKGMFRGVAPGAKLYGFGSGDGDSIIIANAALAYQWIIDHHEDPLENGPAPVPGAPADPPIVVINNSYGTAGDFAPDDLLSLLADAAIAEGIAVVWSAGNDGGSGGRDCADQLQQPVPCTSDRASNPTPGIISVANYDDGETGNRDNALDTTSSRGDAADPSTWPDISAPGTFITSTCPVLSIFCPLGPDINYPPYYGNLSGTSMAAPHVAGIVALLHQANPDLTPAQIEDVLQDTAHKFTAGASYAADPQNPGGTSSYDKGAGLADARLAVLRTLGLPDDLSAQIVQPQVSIDVPTDGETTGASFTASGTANSRTTGGVAPSSPLLADETGQLDHVVASMDLQTLRLSEPGPGLLQVTYTVLNDAGAPPVGHAFDLFYAHDAGSGRLGLTWDPSTDTLECDQVVNDGTTNSSIPLPGCVGAHPGPNTFTLTFPVAEILNGLPVTGTMLRDLWVGSYLGALIDLLPGGIGSLLVNPQRADPYVLSGPSVDTPGVVSVSVDGDDPIEVASGTGVFPWSLAISDLGPGTHTITATLVTGEGSVADTVTFEVV
jgi:serine protease AprX